MKQQVIKEWVEGNLKCQLVRFENGNENVFQSRIDRIYSGVDACNSNLDSLRYEGMTKAQRLEAYGPRGECPSGTWRA